MTEQMEGQMSIFDLDLWSGKMYPEHSQATKEKILDAFSKKQQKSQTVTPLFLDLRKTETENKSGLKQGQLWEMGGLLLGEYTMRSFGECPKDERESHLSQILQGGAATEILFEPKSLYGNTETSRKEEQGTTTDAEGSVGKASCYKEISLESKASGFNGWQSTTSSMPIIDNGTPPIEATMPPYVCNSSDGDIVGTLDANYYKGCGERQGVEREVVAYANEAYDKWSESEKAASLRASGGVYGGGSESLSVGYVVRRLTPLECERLQGYPDGWTDIGEWYDSKGKKHKNADSPRYKALGNSIALPFWQWLADRMCKYIKEPTMASLFDGIGGFPLVFSRAGATPVWASEIEEFPIAVTKLRFKEQI